MKYYIDLAYLGFWVAIFIHTITNPNPEVIMAVAPIAFICCIGHGVVKMFDNDLNRYMQRLSQELKNNEKDDNKK